MSRKKSAATKAVGAISLIVVVTVRVVIVDHLREPFSMKAYPISRAVEAIRYEHQPRREMRPQHPPTERAPTTEAKTKPEPSHDVAASRSPFHNEVRQSNRGVNGDDGNRVTAAGLLAHRITPHPACHRGKGRQAWHQHQPWRKMQPQHPLTFAART